MEPNKQSLYFGDQVDEALVYAIWTQDEIPVIYRPGTKPLFVKLPNSKDNLEWFRRRKQRRPKWDELLKCWKTPNAWFENLAYRTLQRFDRLFIIQPHRKVQKCAPACWYAKGLTCECSCKGGGHGSRDSGDRWWIVSETRALRWGNLELACQFLESSPPVISVLDKAS